ncbi:MAG: citramalate synthase [Planctomycetes bacterium]|nr:citramalate synthase [Planctomycetota bacterium]
MNTEHQQIDLYDTTLRDGCQAEGVSLSLEEKLQLAVKMDELGVHYIEGGFPLSNPKDAEFFKRVSDLDLKTARVAAFGSTCRAETSPEDDIGVQAVLNAETPAVTIVAKAWDLHVEKVLHTSLDENLRMVEETIRYLKDQSREVIVDAEHFFDGVKSNSDQALHVLKVAADAGADVLVLCDTNGGSLVSEVAEWTARVCEEVDVRIGIHCHDDSGLAVANSIVAIENGARHIQGTFNGFGERCGNMDICVAVPILELKTPYTTIGKENLKQITKTSRFAYEIGNMMLRKRQPFVGTSAFAHKGGLHVDAMLKDELTYEHIDPAEVGNERRFLIGELSGRAAVIKKLERYDLTHDGDVMSRILKRVGEMENEGYQFEAAEGSFALLAKKEVGSYHSIFEVEGYHVNIIKQSDGRLVTDATVKLNVNGHREHTASEGDGPVNALDGALRKALEPHYPELANMHLTDYMVRVINPKAATAAKVRVVIQSADPDHSWGTVGVSENIIEASWEALVDSIEYKQLLAEENTAED